MKEKEDASLESIQKKQEGKFLSKKTIEDGTNKRRNEEERKKDEENNTGISKITDIRRESRWAKQKRDSETEQNRKHDTSMHVLNHLFLNNKKDGKEI